jgi:hypothetical protein
VTSLVGIGVRAGCDDLADDIESHDAGVGRRLARDLAEALLLAARDDHLERADQRAAVVRNATVELDADGGAVRERPERAAEDGDAGLGRDPPSATPFGPRMLLGMRLLSFSCSGGVRRHPADRGAPIGAHRRRRR